MIRPSLRRALPFLLWPWCAAPAAAGETTAPRVHHDLVVALAPERGEIEATDRITFPAGLAGLPRTAKGGLRVQLHAGLDARSADPAWILEALEEAPAPGGGEDLGASGLRVATYDLRPASGAWPEEPAPTLRWKGRIHHPPVAEAEDYARSFARSPGTIGPEGAVLSRATWWVPQVGEDLLAFRLRVDLPKGWDAVSQGRRHGAATSGERASVSWECTHPMEEVYLIASPFTRYERAGAGVEAMAYLRTPDEALAARYLDATLQYVDMYRRLVGPYPFEKFALVENFWETGYGMPSFTLLGPQVIRLPFILHSSYPHEILHNWWGNSAYVDWERGNWCEGLTAYMADHLIREGQGRGAEYRFDTLKKYRSYVRAGRDFPLTEFRSRHSGATEAVGYGKCLYLFHMLRRRLGDEAFRAAVARFYRERCWKTSSFEDLERVMSASSGQDLRPWFAAWVGRPGAPDLALSVEGREGGAKVTVRQTGEGEPFPLRVPVALTLAGRRDAMVVELDASARVQTHDVATPAPVVRVDLDPEYDVFRRLDAAEVPPTLGELFGAERVAIVVPAAASDPLAAAWADLARTWKGGRADVEVLDEATLAALPADRSVWVLGERNRWAKAGASALAARGVGPGEAAVEFGETRVPRAGHAWVYVVRHPADEGAALGWIGADLPAAVPGLARKLPHYGKYSWLAFSGEEPTNVAKGQWAPAGSSLVVHVGGGKEGEPAARGALPAREPLARLAPLFDAARLTSHVRFLADERLEGRGNGSPGLDEATAYVAKAFGEAGLEPGGDGGTFFQAFEAPGGPDGRPVRMRNVVGILRGTNPAWAGQSVVLGAHVDHLGRGWPDVREGAQGQVHNGADDNASGVAVLLEVARAQAGRPGGRTLVFVAFSGEEWGLKGSRHYAAAAGAFPARQARAMVNLDTVGRLRDRKLLVLGTGTAREWPFLVMGVAATTGVEATSVPGDPEGSDQVAFREAGVPAVQLFTGGHEDYHRPTDDVEKVDGPGLVKVATFVRETLDYLVERAEPFHPAEGAAGAAPAPAPGEGSARKVLLGTVPDFAHPGPGVRVASVVPGSPAEKAGLAPGDVLVALGGERLESLRGYGEVLKRHAPGDVVRVTWTRDGQETTAEVTLVAR